MRRANKVRRRLDKGEKMKKLTSILLCVALTFGLTTALVGCSSVPREEILKIYMPGEYIDEDIFETFKDWYKAETGKNVTVEMKPFEAVEDIQREVEVSKEDYDLLCPSDYMVEYLIKKGLVQKYDASVIDVKAAGLFKGEYVESTREFDPTLEYAVPYMYGTLGIVYDITKTGKRITGWESLFGSEFSGKRSVKDSMRDAYAAACIYNARNELSGLTGSAQKNAVQALFEDTSAATVKAAGDTLKAIKSGSVWDVDNVKFEMAANNSNVAVALMWSCDAGYVMNDYEDDQGNEKEGNRNLWYVVPEEGGNVYIDAFVISKYAVNVQAANYFLKFLCTTDIAVQNSEYAGCISPVAAAYDELYDYYDTDEDGLFEDTATGWKEMFMETMFPSAETLNRCGVMKDFGDGQAAVTEMWSNIKV